MLAAPPGLAGYSADHIDCGVSPRQDFYRYATGNWLKQTTIPDAESDISGFSMLGNNLDQHHERTLWLIWVPPLSKLVRYEASTRLTLDVTLADAQGGPVWTRTYDDDTGRLVWTIQSADSTPLPTEIERVVHESAWRLAQRASHDLREWMDTERMRPRSL